MDLNELSLEELKKLKRDAEKAIASFEGRRLQEARKKLEEYAKEIGVDFDEVAALQKSSKTVNPPKYRHPKDPNKTWTGRGRQPAWIKEALNAGKSLDAYAI